MDVSIIIVNYNTLNLTKDTIDSVLEKTKGISYEIILVDNASKDGSIKFFEKNYKDKIIFIKNKENLGFGRANNKGIEIAKGKYIFLLNSDTLLINNAIKILFDFMEENKKCGICGGNLYSINFEPMHSFKNKLPDIQSEFHEYINMFEKVKEKVLKKENDFNFSLLPKEVGYITGADMLIRKEILNEIKGFDEDFFMYSEEAELTYRVKNKGYKVYSVPDAKIIHLEGKSTKIKVKKIEMQLDGKYKYYQKTYGKEACKKLYIISQIGFFIRAILTLKFDYLKIIKINRKKYLTLKNS